MGQMLYRRYLLIFLSFLWGEQLLITVGVWGKYISDGKVRCWSHTASFLAWVLLKAAPEGDKGGFLGKDSLEQ